MKHGTTCLLIVYGILIVCLYIRKFLTKEFTILTEPSDESWGILVKFINDIYEGMPLNDAPGDVIPLELDCDVHIKGDLLVGTYGTRLNGVFKENEGDDRMQQNKNNARSKKDSVGALWPDPLLNTGEIYSWYANSTELNTTSIKNREIDNAAISRPLYTCSRKTYKEYTSTNLSQLYQDSLDGLYCNTTNVNMVCPSSQFTDTPHDSYRSRHTGAAYGSGSQGNNYGMKYGHPKDNENWGKGWMFKCDGPTYNLTGLGYIVDDPYILIIEGNVNSTSTTFPFYCGTFHSEHKFYSHSEVRFTKTLGSIGRSSSDWRGYNTYDKGWLYFNGGSLCRRAGFDTGTYQYRFPRKW